MWIIIDQGDWSEMIITISYLSVCYPVGWQGIVADFNSKRGIELLDVCKAINFVVTKMGGLTTKAE